MTRFILLEKPLVHPQVDIVNRAPEGPVFDLSVDLNGYDGPVYLRVDHVEEMARQLGYVHPDVVNELLDTIKVQQSKLAMLPDPVELAELKNGIDRYIGAFLGNDSGDSVVKPEPSKGSDPAGEKPERATGQTIDITG